MKISKEDLQKIIKEEVNEIFGFGKKKKGSKEYPATELTTLLGMIQKASRQSGVKFKGRRGALVDEFEKILSSDGFKLKEANERIFIGKDGNIAIDPADAPVLTNFLTNLKSQAPDTFKQLAKQMNNYRFDLPDSGTEEEIPSITTVADLDPDAPDIPAGQVQMDLSDEEEEDTDMSTLPFTDDARAASADAISSATQQAPKSSEAEDFIAQQFSKKVPLATIKNFAQSVDLDGPTARKVVKVVRDAGYTLSEGQIKRLKKIAGIK